MNVVINPGTQPVIQHTKEMAAENMRHFCTDVAGRLDSGARMRFLFTGDEDRGRYQFILWVDNNCTEIDMPGASLDVVRFVKSPGQNPWHFYRLYVDGVSWLWWLAVDIVVDLLSGEDMDDK